MVAVRPMVVLRVGLMLGLCALGGVAFAQAAAPAPTPTPEQVAAGAAGRPTPEEVQRIPKKTDVRSSKLTVETEAQKCPLADVRFRDVKVTLTSVVFDGVGKLVPPEKLRSTYEDLLGKPVPIAVVCDIRDAAAAILRREGFLAAVQVPPQRIEGGVLHFDVLTAKLIGLRVRGRTGGAESRIAAYLQKLVGQPAFNQSDAERYLLLAKDLPGYDVRLRLRAAGTVPGEVIGEITVQKMPFAIDTYIQNFGSHDVGRVGALARVEFYDILGLGDRGSVGVYATTKTREQQIAQAAYEMRFGGEGLTLGGSITYAYTRPTNPNKALGQVKSRTVLASVQMAYPFIRAQAHTVKGEIGMDYLNQKVGLTPVTGPFVPLSKDRIRVAYAQIEFDAADPHSAIGTGGYSATEPFWHVGGTVTARRGLNILKSTPDCGPPPYKLCKVSLGRIDGRPDAWVVRSNMVFELRPTPLITLALSPRGQYSWKPLVSFEEISGGNYTIGRAYDPGVISGDRGIGFQAELRYGHIVPRSRDVPALQPFLFMDREWTWNIPPPPPATAPTTLRPDPQNVFSAGGGVRATLGRFGHLEVTIATPIKQAGLQMKDGPVRVLASLTTRLWPR
jgi:hemolysin activation/secretion protein